MRKSIRQLEVIFWLAFIKWVGVAVLVWVFVILSAEGIID